MKKLIVIPLALTVVGCGSSGGDSCADMIGTWARPSKTIEISKTATGYAIAGTGKTPGNWTGTCENGVIKTGDAKAGDIAYEGYKVVNDTSVMFGTDRYTHRN
jgi:hypothetical protein